MLARCLDHLRAWSNSVTVLRRTESNVRESTTRARISKQCKRCGITFEVIPARRNKARYCSRACVSNRRSSACETCGVAFDYPTCEGERRFCSIVCKAESQRKQAPQGMKWCCMGQHFALKSSFSKSADRLDGLVTHCKSCKKIYESDRKEINRLHKQAYRRRNPDKIIKQRLKWAKANKEQLDAIRRHYAAFNPEKVKASKCRSRAKRSGAIGSHSHADWLLKIGYFGWRCHYCGVTLTADTLTKDHRKPLSKGGTNFLANLAPACAKCNSAKRARPESEFREIKLRRHVLSADNGVDTISGSATANGAA
jgi:5-methylcytosine-specific restriction endonuclease McrA